MRQPEGLLWVEAETLKGYLNFRRPPPSYLDLRVEKRIPRLVLTAASTDARVGQNGRRVNDEFISATPCSKGV